MRKTQRSGCPINLTLEMIGDRWSLIVIRDVMFGNRRHYGDLLRLSDEGIASNILADRLARLVNARLLSRTDNPAHKQKAIYSLTEASIQLVPLLAQMGAWGRRHAPASKELSIRAQLLKRGANDCGKPSWQNSAACTLARLRRDDPYLLNSRKHSSLLSGGEINRQPPQRSNSAGG